jgi:hypothetical protein
MYLQDPDSEQRLSKLQAQLDRLSLTLQQSQEHLQPIEWRLSQLLRQCGEILTRLTAVNERNQRVAEEVESRLSDPITAVREQAARLGEICVTAANSVSGFERTESRFAALESDVRLRLNQVTDDLHALVAELRVGAGHPPSSLAGTAATWPLEGVMRLHDELRTGSEGHDSSPPGAADSPALPEAAAALAGRIESLERAATAEREELALAVARTRHQRRSWSAAFAALSVAVIGTGVLAFTLQRRVDASLREAAARATAAEQQATAAAEFASKQIASTQEAADRQLAEAHQTALKAQVISDVLAAPDLVRFGLTSGSAASRGYAQMLWSRSRGLVFSASRLPSAPPGTTYQIWLLTSAEPVSGGLFVPDSAGRVTLATDDPPKVLRPVTGVTVTLEPSDGRPAPSGPTMLARPAPP